MSTLKSAVLLLISCVLPIKAETVSVATQYPSPLGVYKSMRSLGNTFLAVTGGNVGIGTANASQKLYVEGTGYFSGNLGLGVSPSQKLHVSGNALITGYIDIGSSFGSYNLNINENSNGFVGGYFRNLDLGSSSSVGLILSDGSSGGESGLRKYSDASVAYPNKLLIYSTRAGSGLAFQVQTTRAMDIISGGNVGIGTSSPNAKLDVVGNIQMGSSGQYYATGGEENLRLIRGGCGSDGSTSPWGSGFSCSRTATGTYSVTYTNAFSAPAVPVSQIGIFPGSCPCHGYLKTTGFTAAGFSIETRDINDNLRDASFYFVVAGPK